jgi:hypothetical protein
MNTVVDLTCVIVGKKNYNGLHSKIRIRTELRCMPFCL